jgi:hypothetical protein
MVGRVEWNMQSEGATVGQPLAAGTKLPSASEPICFFIVDARNLRFYNRSTKIGAACGTLIYFIRSLQEQKFRFVIL